MHSTLPGEPRPRSHHRLRRSWGVAACVFAALALTACSTATPARLAVSERSAAKLPSPSTTALRLSAGQWNNPLSYNPYSPNSFGWMQYWAQLYLGYAYLKSSGNHANGLYGFYPELARSWTLTNSSLTFHLRPSARWQDGNAFTAKDVVTSLLLAGVNHNGEWAGFSSITSPDTHTVVVHLAPDSVPIDLLYDVIATPIIPASQYDRFTPAGLEADLVAYWRLYKPKDPTTATINAATNSAAGKTIARLDTQLVKYNPKTLVGDGPYKLVRANSQQILMERWSGWYDVKDIRVPWVELFSLDSSSEYGALLDGRIDLETDNQYTDPDASHLDATPGRKYLVVYAPFEQEGLIFNVRDYPYSLAPVRQALAYLINRNTLTRLDIGGSLIQDPAATRPDGLPNPTNTSYLTKGQYRSLNAYSYRPSKAAALLRSVGFTERGGAWYTPKHTKFSLTLYVPSGDQQFEEDATVISKTLQSFGIHATAQTAEATGFYSEQQDGDYSVSEGFPVAGSFNPLSYYNYTFLTYNYPATYSGVGNCSGCNVAIGIGPHVVVPGLGKVNLGAAINAEYLFAPRDQWRRYLWDWARYVNRELPYLPLYDNSFHDAYSEVHYTDWPSASVSKVWTAGGDGSQMIIAQQLGYLKLRKKG